MGQYPSSRVYEEPLKTQFEASSCGSWTLLLLSHSAVLVLPAVIGFAMGNFWETVDTTVVERPQMVYSGRTMLRAVTESGDEYLWTSQPKLTEQLIGDPRATMPFFSLLQDDANRDGHVDTFAFHVRIPLRSPGHKITLVQLLPTFTYTLDTDDVYVQMETAPFVTYNGAPASSCLVLDGFATFKQRGLLRADAWYRYDRVYRRSYMLNKDGTSNTVTYPHPTNSSYGEGEDYYNPADELDVADLTDMAGIFAQRYNARNESTPFELSTAYFTSVGNTAGHGSRNNNNAMMPSCGPVTSAASMIPPQSPITSLSAPLDDNNFFSFHATIRVPPATIQYVPTLASNLKHAWVQYFVIAYAVRWFFMGIRKVFATQAWITTNARLVRPNFFYA